MKIYNTPYDVVMQMPVHRFFLLIDEIPKIEGGESTETKEPLKKLETENDFISFLF